jgi:hypothetical protein
MRKLITTALQIYLSHIEEWDTTCTFQYHTATLLDYLYDVTKLTCRCGGSKNMCDTEKPY